MRCPIPSRSPRTPDGYLGYVAGCELAAITRLERRIAAGRVYVTSAHCPHARGSGNVTQYQASVNSVSGDQYLKSRC